LKKLVSPSSGLKELLPVTSWLAEVLPVTSGLAEALPVTSGLAEVLPVTSGLAELPPEGTSGKLRRRISVNPKDGGSMFPRNVCLQTYTLSKSKFVV
jgi:hypothetical protein